MLKYYKLPSIKGEGWAHISLNLETGFFATVSDWGNYSYIWTHPGGEFRKFLMETQPDYLLGKLMMGRPNAKEFDKEATVKQIEEALAERRVSYLERKGVEWVRYNAELKAAKDIKNKEDFEAWVSTTALGDAYEFYSSRPNPECMGFCTKVWPRFVKLLKEELEKEERDKKDAEAIRQAAPAIVDAVREDIKALSTSATKATR
jgi:hypothetical protein